VQKTNQAGASTTTLEEVVVKKNHLWEFKKKQCKKKGWANNQGQLAFFWGQKEKQSIYHGAAMHSQGFFNLCRMPYHLLKKLSF